MKKEDGCHKNQKTGQQRKGEDKAKNKMEEGPKTRAKRGKKKGHKLGHTRAVQKEENEW